MSLVDYSQTAHDHQTLLVLVHHTGSGLSTHSFNTAWDHIRRVNCVRVHGQNRDIYVRYKRGYPIENNEWGDFQAHRKVLGLISIGRCSSHEEFESLFESYKSVKKDYASTIYNSRLIVFGMNRDGSPLTKPDAENVHDHETKSENHHHSRKDSLHKHSKSVDDNSDVDKGPTSPSSSKSAHSKPMSTSRSHSNSLTKESTGAEVVFYPDLDNATDLEDRLKEFATSLFFVLEGKRLDRSFERTERLQLLCAPHEKKVFVGLDTDSKSIKRKCMGRLRKHLGDLCLQAGMPGEAILHYQTSLDVLRNLNDFLWMAGCYEGLSAASVILKYPRTEETTLKRNLSFNVVQSSPPAINIATKSTTYVNGLDIAERSSSGVLHPDDIIDKYEEAIKHYSKFKNAAMIEMEASFKACRVLIMQRVPASLITTNWNTSLPPTTPTALQVIRCHIDLQDSFLRLHAIPACRASSLHLENLYCCEVGRVEMGRYQTMCSGHGRQSVNAFYDEERIKLASRIRVELEKISLLALQSGVSVCGGRLMMGVSSLSPAVPGIHQSNLASAVPSPVTHQSNVSAAAAAATSACITDQVPLTSIRRSSSTLSSISESSSINKSTSRVSAHVTHNKHLPISDMTVSDLTRNPSVTQTKQLSNINIVSSSDFFKPHLTSEAKAVSSPVITSTSSPSGNKPFSRRPFNIEDLLDTSSYSASPEAERDEVNNLESRAPTDVNSPVSDASDSPREEMSYDDVSSASEESHCSSDQNRSRRIQMYDAVDSKTDSERSHDWSPASGSSIDVTDSCNDAGQVTNTSAFSTDLRPSENDLSPTITSASNKDSKTFPDMAGHVCVADTTASIDVDALSSNASPRDLGFTIGKKTSCDDTRLPSNVLFTSSDMKTSPISDYPSPNTLASSCDMKASTYGTTATTASSIDTKTFHHGISPVPSTLSSRIPESFDTSSNISGSRISESFDAKTFHGISPSLNTSSSRISESFDAKTFHGISPSPSISGSTTSKSFNSTSPVSDFVSPGDEGRGMMMFTPTLTPHEQTRQQRLNTTRILTEWYNSHVQYPYPSDQDVSVLCDLTEIKPSQVRKWLANKRVRSFNTLSITGNDHPIKYKYQKSDHCAAGVAPTRRPQYKVLNNHAKTVLANWFDNHVMNPYPTDEEKEILAQSAEISVGQVKSWFANKRSRTNNTRKQIPNYFIKKYPSYTPIVQMVVEQRLQRKQASQFDKLRVSLFPS